VDYFFLEQVEEVYFNRLTIVFTSHTGDFLLPVLALILDNGLQSLPSGSFARDAG
jgi:hypothetical protein